RNGAVFDDHRAEIAVQVQAAATNRSVIAGNRTSLQLQSRAAGVDASAITRRIARDHRVANCSGAAANIGEGEVDAPTRVAGAISCDGTVFHYQRAEWQ